MWAELLFVEVLVPGDNQTYKVSPLFFDVMVKTFALAFAAITFLLVI